MFKKALTVVTLSSFACVTLANEDTPDNVKFGLILGAAFGGDKMAYVEFEDGSDNSVEAGSGIFLGASAQTKIYQAGSLPIDAKIAMSYMFDTITASNGDITFSRFPVDFIIMSQASNISFGGGVTYHLNPKLDVDIDGYSSFKSSYDDAFGTKFEVNYHFENNKNISIGMEYTNITYKNDFEEYDGSGIGISLKFLL